MYNTVKDNESEYAAEESIKQNIQGQEKKEPVRDSKYCNEQNLYINDDKNNDFEHISQGIVEKGIQKQVNVCETSIQSTECKRYFEQTTPRITRESFQGEEVIEKNVHVGNTLNILDMKAQGQGNLDKQFKQKENNIIEDPNTSRMEGQSTHGPEPFGEKEGELINLPSKQKEDEFILRESALSIVGKTEEALEKFTTVEKFPVGVISNETKGEEKMSGNSSSQRDVQHEPSVQNDGAFNPEPSILSVESNRAESLEKIKSVDKYQEEKICIGMYQ